MVNCQMWGVRMRHMRASPPVLGPDEILARREVERQTQERRQNEAQVGAYVGKKWLKSAQEVPERAVEMTFPTSRGLLPVEAEKDQSQSEPVEWK